MIHTFLKYLTNNSIDYVITNGYEELFVKKASENDVDILFKKKVFLSIEKIVKSFCEIEGYKIVQIYHQEIYAKNIFLFNPKTQEILNLDMYGLFHRNHIIYFTETEIFNNTLSYKGITILATHQEFFQYFLKKITKKDISLRVFKYLKKLFLKDDINCKKTIETHLVKTGKKINEAFLKDDINALLKEENNILLDIKKGKPAAFYQLKEKVRILKRILNPTGISIAFLGPDGSGKTTIINGLVASNLPFRKTNYFHLKPIKTSGENNEVITNPHEFKPYGKLKSYVKLCYFLFQYNFGWLKNIIPLKVQSSLIIFDRYFDDLIADTKRYRYGGSSSMAKFFRLFIKKPALYFILVTDAKTIYKRKQEVAFSELDRQIKNYKSLADNKKYFEIDVSNPPNIIVKDVISILMKKMYERY